MKNADNTRRIETYKQTLVSQFSFLKQTSSIDQLHARGIALTSGGMLVPICELHDGITEWIDLFSDWRARHQDAYPTQFPVTRQGTTDWLRKRLLDVPDRILFLVIDRHGRPIGHMGYANCLNDQQEMEIDNVVRGVEDASPGIMEEAMTHLLEWAHVNFWPELISLRVFSDNTHAVQFYEKTGFKNAQTIALRKQTNGDAISFHAIAPGESSPTDRLFQRMELVPFRPGMGTETILTAGPSITGRETGYAQDAVRHGWNANWGSYLSRFEQSFAEYIGVEHALATSSCTGALHIALKALGIGPGDEVIVPDVTWVATANAVLYVGATPIFADVDLNTWCLDPASFEAAITPRTRAVMPVHLYGHPCEMDKIVEIANKHGLAIVEDAAPSVGAEFKGKRTGTFGHYACFSFQGAKLAVTGEGGMLVSRDAQLHRKAYAIWDQGRRPGTFWIEAQGLKYKLANPLAAIGLAQLERNEAMIEAKRRIFDWYQEGIGDLPQVVLNHEAPWARSICWMTSIRLQDNAGINRDAVIAALKARHVESRPAFPAISQYPIWPTRQEAGKNASIIGTQAINLPSGVCLHRNEVDYICEVIQGIFR